MDLIPLEILFAGTIVLIYLAIELGYRAGNTHLPALKIAKEKITSTNASAVLGMLAFVLVFAFSIVYGRYETKKELVRDEANIIRNAWTRSDFLPDADRTDTKNQIKRYVDLRLELSDSNEMDKLHRVLEESNSIQYRLWETAVVNAKKDMNSDVAALYIESLNEMMNQQAIRVSIGAIVRVPAFIWIILYLMVFLGMFSIGYQTSITNSSRNSWLTPVMVLSFSLMLLVIAALDRPDNGYIRVSQQPLEDLRVWMDKSEKLVR
jgi:hypothetical protein